MFKIIEGMQTKILKQYEIKNICDVYNIESKNRIIFPRNPDDVTDLAPCYLDIHLLRHSRFILRDNTEVIDIWCNMIIRVDIFQYTLEAN